MIPMKNILLCFTQKINLVDHMHENLIPLGGGGGGGGIIQTLLYFLLFRHIGIYPFYMESTVIEGRGDLMHLVMLLDNRHSPMHPCLHH